MVKKTVKIPFPPEILISPSTTLEKGCGNLAVFRNFKIDLETLVLSFFPDLGLIH